MHRAFLAPKRPRPCYLIVLCDTLESIARSIRFRTGSRCRRWILDKLRSLASPGSRAKEGHSPAFLLSRFACQLACASLSLLLAAPAQALSENEIDSLVDEGVRMKELMMRMQSQLHQSGLPESGVSGTSGRDSGGSLADSSSWVSTSAMLDGSLRERWFRAIEQGVLGRFAAFPGEEDQEDAQVPVVVGFVHGEEIPWYGSLQVRGYNENSALTDSAEAKARLMVAPRFEDGSFLHVGLSFQSFSYWGEDADLDMLAGGERAQGFGRHLAFDIGYSQESYAIQAQYLKSRDRKESQAFHDRAKSNVDGFHIRGAWRITGEQTQSRYAPGLLAHIEPRDEEGIWELVVRYANLDNRAESLAEGSDSMLLGIHWRADSTLALELDYVEGNGEDFRALNDGGLTLRGTLSF